jgi:XTP/dITP diphosphohydrolase
LGTAADREPARLVLVVTSPRVPAGCLTWPAWLALREGAVCTATDDHPQLPALAAAGIEVELLPAEAPATELARIFRDHASPGRPAVWLGAPDGDEAFAAALGQLVATAPDAEVELVHGSYDLPGARLLDAVAVMDRLRSPGGCPWDAEQTHASLAPYLLEEAYEAYQAIEDADDDALREELGDVLLQVLFHARIAEERVADGDAHGDADGGWTVDDVAGDLVAKLVRRHPHVFAETAVSGADDVQRNWDALKAAEKGDAASVTAGVPLGQPALSLAAKLQKRASAAGLPPALLSPVLGAAPSPDAAVAMAAGAVEEHAAEHGTDVVTAVGELLFAAVALARAHEVDPEAALRGYARAFRDRLATAEQALRVDGADPADPTAWRERWTATPGAVSGELVDGRPAS